MDRAKQELIELQSGQAEREARNRVTHAEEKVRRMSPMFYRYPLFLLFYIFRATKTVVELLRSHTAHRADMGDTHIDFISGYSTSSHLISSNEAHPALNVLNIFRLNLTDSAITLRDSR